LKISIKLLLSLFYGINAVLLPYLPLLLDQRGFSVAETGTLLMLGPFLAMFIQPATGIISDKIRATKPLIIGLWILLGISSIFLFTADQMTIVAISVIALYIFFQPTASLVDTLTIKSAREINKPYDSFRLWGSVGFMVALLIIGQSFEALGGVDSLLWMFAPLWAGFMLLIVIVREPKSSTIESGKSDVVQATVNLKVIRETLSNPKVLIFFGLFFLIAMPHRMNDALLTIHLQTLGATSSQLSLAWATAGVGEVIGFFLIGKMMRSYSIKAIFALVALLYAIRWLLYAVVTDPAIVVILQTSHAFTFVALWSFGIKYISTTLPKHLLATGLSLFSMVYLGVSGLVGGSLGGLLQQNFGESVMYGMGVVTSLAAAAGFYIWDRSTKKVAEIS
jgi:MFS transporter, PPP family, 3-phenylpropionic acid transporter